MGSLANMSSLVKRRFKAPRRVVKRLKKSGEQLRQAKASRLLNYGGIGIAPGIFTQVEFARNIQFNISTGNAGLISTYQSSLYDPVTNINVSGQPRYFDQYMALYQNYCVTGMKVKFSFFNCSTEVLKVAAMFIAGSQFDSNNFEDFLEARESLGGKFVAPTSGAPGSAVIEGYRSVSRVFGVKDVLNQPEYWGQATTNPANMISVRVGVFTQDGQAHLDSSTLTCSLDIRIKYYCKFFNPVAVGDSFTREQTGTILDVDTPPD